MTGTTSPRSTIRPAYITMTRSAISATTPRLCVMNTIAMPVSRCRSCSSCRIWACTVTSSAVVGSSAISTAGSQASAMAIITRCRMPPERWCGKAARRRRASEMPTRSRRCSARSSASRRPTAAVGHHGFGDLVADPLHGIERRHGLLEDHGDLVAAQRPHGGLGHGQQVPDGAIAATEQRATVDPGSRRRRGEPHHGEARDALARAGLAHQRQGLTRLHREGHVVHGRDEPGMGRERDR